MDVLKAVKVKVILAPIRRTMEAKGELPLAFPQQD
jgi:hypothetical protein